MTKKEKIIEMDISKIKEYPNNHKIHSPEHVEELADSISRFGLMEPILVDKSNMIVSGHGRFMAAKKLGWKKMPVMVSDMSERETIIARIAANKTAGMDYDEEMIADEVRAFFNHDGVSDDELEGITKGTGIALKDVELIMKAEDIDYDSVAADSDSAVEEFSKDTEQKAKEAAEKEVGAGSALGVGKFTNSEILTINEAMGILKDKFGVEDNKEALMKSFQEIVDEQYS